MEKITDVACVKNEIYKDSIYNLSKILVLVSIISWLSMLYALNGRKVTVWILIRYEKVNI